MRTPSGDPGPDAATPATRWRMVPVLAILLVVGGSLVAGLDAPRGDGAHWRDAGPAGHAELVERLSQQHDVRVLESSLALLPAVAGPGDTLFLFPTHRAPVQDELDRVRGFVSGGGHLAVATDGGSAMDWADAFGVRLHGMPALLPPGQAGDCIAAEFRVGGQVHGICLPSPTAFPNLTTAGSGVTFAEVGSSSVPVLLDTDGDGNLSVGDQGPVAVRLVLQWQAGAGRITAIADADLWRNGVPGQQSNLLLAEALAGGGGTVYVDNSGVQPTYKDRVAGSWYRALSSTSAAAAWLLVPILVATVSAAMLAPRIKPLRPHDPLEDAVDPTVEAAAQRILQAHLGTTRLAARDDEGKTDPSKATKVKP